MEKLKILAGSGAYKHIQTNGLSPDHISAIFGASGAAKWLTIYGFDKAVFSEWLPRSTQPVDLLGTSVGAFKLAAAATADPAAALTRFAEAYIAQDYVDKDPATQIVIETDNVINAFLNQQSTVEILNHPRFNYHCGAVRCKGWLAQENPTRLKLAMLKALAKSATGRSSYQSLFQRVVFYSKANSFGGADQFDTQAVQLTTENFRPAIQSSGSIPVVMPGVADIPGASPGMYRDGGLLDYHPVPGNFSCSDGLVLYPHFYSHLKEGWFDKFWPKRKARAAQLDNTLLIAPSDSFVASLPGGRIPDRGDFQRFAKNDSERIRRWNEAMARSLELGEEFIRLADSGDIAAQIELID